MSIAPENLFPGFRTPPNEAPQPSHHIVTRDEEQDDCYDDEEYERCEMCGGDGIIEYLEGGPSVWGEDCPSMANHLLTCPECRGRGV